jgi:rubrerythrin
VSQKIGIEEALKTAMAAELEAQAFYSRAASKVQDPNGRDLLGRLAAFEQYHYEKLDTLRQSLQEAGSFVEYQTRTIEEFAPTVSSGETAGTELEDLTDPPSILIKAIENEKMAGERYRDLALATDDPTGVAMFNDLANEEMLHQRILEDEFYSLSNTGVWGWSGMYGE